MAAFRSFVLLIAVFVFTSLDSNASAQSIAKTHSKIKSLATAENAEQSKYLTTTYALFSIFDEKFADRVLAKAPDYSHFRDRVDEWIAADSTAWNLLSTHLDYCNRLRSEGKLGTDIDSDDADIRWVFFVVYGEPSNELVLPCRCSQGEGACSVWTYTWLPTDIVEPGEELSCQSRPNGSFPTIFVPNDDASFLRAGPIWPIVNCSRFPTAGGMADIWFGVWVPGNQFTRPTLDSARLKVEVEIFDSSRSVSVTKGSCISDLRIIRGILEATEPQDRHLIRAMGYIGFANVKSGRYFAHVTVAGAPNNEGEAWLEVVIPDDARISDLLILGNSAGSSEDVQSGIIRGTKNSLYDNPEALFARGERLNLYVESELPRQSEKGIEVWATLLPMPEVSRRYKSTVTTGEFVVVADSLDNPIISDKWQTPEGQELLEELAHAQTNSKAITLLRKRIEVSGDAVLVELAPKLKSDLKPGKYLLTVSISDPKHKSDILTARRLIQIAAAASSPPKNRFRTLGQ
ncbi:MAG: hypothetical protein WBP29_04215 [Candidatus Zixiibacteriota bacterium]